jgi:alpha-L-fucosidase
MGDLKWFENARYGLFIHYGLYSLLGRGEWVLNREEIPLEEYRRLADRFTAEHFDAEAICDLAVRAGMRYVVLTTMHHDGFRLYDTALSRFSTAATAAQRDLVAELVAAARKRGLRIGLYHSLNIWSETPDAVDALEGKAAYDRFLETVFARLRELATKYAPFDTMWYDGWWPFNAEQWQGERMNAMVRQIQPHILFNGRNGLPGDFATPEGHLGAPHPYRPWEACITLNNSWGYMPGDQDWKTPGQVVDMLARVAQGRGNLLLNIGPRGDGSVPEESVRVLTTVGDWLKRCGECIYDTDLFTMDLQARGDHRADWNHLGPVTVRGNHLYWLVRRWCGARATLGGVQVPVRKVTVLGTGRSVAFKQSGTRVELTGLPEAVPDPVCPVLRLECDRAPVLYQCGGLRVPKVAHPHYDPCPSDLLA